MRCYLHTLDTTWTLPAWGVETEHTLIFQLEGSQWELALLNGVMWLCSVVEHGPPVASQRHAVRLIAQAHTSDHSQSVHLLGGAGQVPTLIVAACRAS